MLYVYIYISSTVQREDEMTGLPSRSVQLEDGEVPKKIVLQSKYSIVFSFFQIHGVFFSVCFFASNMAWPLCIRNL